jgi:hypothetical protein
MSLDPVSRTYDSAFQIRVTKKAVSQIVIRNTDLETLLCQIH